jgi:hypothetical protein
VVCVRRRGGERGAGHERSRGWLGGGLSEGRFVDLEPQDIELHGCCGITLTAIATGIAILRYRLYDIDLIINRTLVYGALTASLAAIYAALTIASQTVVLRARATGEVPDVVVAAATLAVAALFQPLRRRIQTFIDRRFYRRRYDAARILDDFSARLRDEVNLDSMTSELVVVVGNTMRPAHASLWLRA